MSLSFDELRALPDEELIRRHDHKAVHVEEGVNYFLDELKRRESSRTNEQMAALAGETHGATEEMRRLTRVITVLTAVNVFAAVVGVIGQL